MREKLNLELNADSLIKKSGLTKIEFGRLMGVKKQNINQLLTTKNVVTLRRISEVLNVPLETLIRRDGDEHTINGYVEIDGNAYRIRSINDMRRAMTDAESLFVG